jgi:hypothetical protein
MGDPGADGEDIGVADEEPLRLEMLDGEDSGGITAKGDTLITPPNGEDNCVIDKEPLRLPAPVGEEADGLMLKAGA